MKLIDNCIDEFKRKLNQQNNETTRTNKIQVYYQNQMTDQYRKNEKIIKDIIYKHVKPVDNNDELNLIIYYKDIKTKNLVMKNNLNKNQEKLLKSWTPYKYTCNDEDCELLNPTYIGQTRNTIQTRLEQHANDGAIKEHAQTKHKKKITVQKLEENTEPVIQFNDIKKLNMYKAILLMQNRPQIKRQKDNFIKTFKRCDRQPNLQTNTARPSIQNNVTHIYPPIKTI